ncbi:MAG TPA: MFS transporter, partial [Streptosporangiaceae bacterium]|nr:MFS transporter [Streptosporangiaceae bacterium]
MLMILAVVMTGCAFAPFIYTQLWLQSVLGLPAIEAGLVLLPMAGTAFVVSALAGRFMHGMAARWPLGLGLVLIGAGSLLRAFLTASSGWPALIAGLVVSGVGVGLAAPVLVSATLSSVPRPRSGMASGAVNTFRQIGYALGIAAFGSLFASRIAGVARARVTRHAVHAAYATAQNDIYLVAGLAAVACGLAALALIRPGAPAQPAAPAPASAGPETAQTASPVPG